jgi:hypothetical protein
VIAGTLLLVVEVPLSLLLASSGSLVSNDNGDPTAVGYAAQAVVSLAVTTLAIPVLSGVMALLYLDRRIRREGLDVSLSEAAKAGVPLSLAAPAVPPTHPAPPPPRFPPGPPGPPPPPGQVITPGPWRPGAVTGPTGWPR